MVYCQRVFLSLPVSRTFLLLPLLLCLASPACRPAPDSPEGQARWVAETLGRLTLEQKAGQMVVARFYGDMQRSGDDSLGTLEKWVAGGSVGGLLLASRLEGTAVRPAAASDVAALLNRLQSAAGVPLLVGADLERGAGMRLGGATWLPPPMALAAGGDPGAAFAAGKAAGEEARAAGINWVFAPVADVNSNPRNPIINVRSFGERPEAVSQYVAEFVRGAHAGGVLATAKHFPGHGDTETDSHLELPVISSSREVLETVNLPPFRAAIAAGVDAVMTGHMVVPALESGPAADSEHLPPATLSRSILGNLLREKLQFSGLIVTDALEMQALAGGGPPSEIAVRAMEAGADVLLLPPDPQAAQQALIAAVRNGRLTESRIDASVRRILAAKARLGLHAQRLPQPQALPESLSRPDRLAMAEQLAARSLVLLGEPHALLPIDSANLLLLLFAEADDPDQGVAFAEEMRVQFPPADIVRLEPAVSVALQLEIIARARRAGRVVCAVYIHAAASKGTVALDPAYADLLQKLYAANRRLLLVAFGSPYFLADLRFHSPASLLTFDASPLAERAAARALAGEAPITGKLPVTIPGFAAYGDGAELAVPASPSVLSGAIP